MAERISTALSVTHEALHATGAFDRFVDLDSQLHIDPHLLRTSAAGEMVESAQTVESYWHDTAVILHRVQQRHDALWREANRRMTFPENQYVGLGYAKTGTVGAGIGHGLSERLTDTGLQIVRAGIDDPKIFELVGLFEPDIGPDKISDMAVHIIEPHLLGYTERICRELTLETRSIRVRNGVYQLPLDPKSGKRIVLTPRDILRDLPVAFSWDEVDIICSYNDSIRRSVNSIIGDTWRKATTRVKKERLREVLFANPELLKDLLHQYRQKLGEPYDFATDVLGEQNWVEVAKQVVHDHPLNLLEYGRVTPENIMQIVRTICDHFRKLVEDGGLSYLFWTDAGELRHERAAQRLFFGIADAYCKANNLDLSAEPSAGRGPVDFKISRGYNARVLVEVKWSNNSKFADGFGKQLPQLLPKVPHIRFTW